MAYSKTVSLFADGYTLFLKTGEGVIAQRHRGGAIEFMPRRAHAHVKITRAQAFRYWDKHFAGRYADDLPAPLAEAVWLSPWEESDFAIDSVTCSKVWR